MKSSREAYKLLHDRMAGAPIIVPKQTKSALQSEGRANDAIFVVGPARATPPDVHGAADAVSDSAILVLSGLTKLARSGELHNRF